MWTSVTSPRSPSPTPSRPTLRLSPQAGIAPLTTTVLSRRTPTPADRGWRIALRLRGTDWDERAWEVTLEGETGDTLVRLTWAGIPAGQYDVFSCIAPRGPCAQAPLLVIE